MKQAIFFAIIMALLGCTFGSSLWLFRTNAYVGTLTYNQATVASSGEITWGSEQTLASSGFGWAPFPYVFNGDLFLYHYGTGPNLYVNQYTTSWSGDVLIPTPSAPARGPSVAYFLNVLWLFYPTSDGSLWYSTSSDGVNFVQPHEKVPGNPSITNSVFPIVYSSSLYVFYQKSNNHLAYNRNDGTGWVGETSISGITLLLNPTALVYGGILYVFHQAAAGNGDLYYATFDGSNWSDTNIPAIIEPINQYGGPFGINILGNFYIYYPGADNTIYYYAINPSGGPEGSGHVYEAITETTDTVGAIIY